MTEAAAQHAVRQQVDRALARKLEAAHGWCISQYAASLARLRPQVGAAVLPIAGGVAIYTGPSPFSFTVGAGMNEPVTETDLDQIEEFFFSRNHAVRIDVTPFTDPSLEELVRRRGYRFSELTSVLGRSLETDLPATEWPKDVIVRWAHEDELDLLIEVIARCFFVQDPGADRRENMRALFGVPKALNTFAVTRGEVVGVASGMISDDREIAVFFGSATRPEFRRRGIHRAMLQFRLARAKAEGCKLAVITATPGSTSERNLHRHGFETCYQKVTYTSG
jgi:ribosomal protein S18 acetylase RimI-like enzyme